MASYNTVQRKKLIDFLKQNPDRQFSVKQIYDELSDSTISLSAVYRNISALEAEGVINRLVKEGSREIMYQYTHSELCRNSIHLTCVKCGKTFHMNHKQTDKMIESVKESDGFEINKSKTVLYGSCKSCVQQEVL